MMPNDVVFGGEARPKVGRGREDEIEAEAKPTGTQGATNHGRLTTSFSAKESQRTLQDVESSIRIRHTG